MPRVLVINPNTTAAMTETVVAVARDLLPGCEIVAETARCGPAVIATPASYALAVDNAVQCYESHAGPVDAVMLACFGDPGLAQLRARTDVPVTALLEAAVHAAVAPGAPFGIVTAGPQWRAMLDERVAPMPGAALYRGTEALDFDGLAIARDPDLAIAAMLVAATRLASAGARTVILGGAAMAGLAPRLAGNPSMASLTFIDPVRAACSQLAESLEMPRRP